MTNPDPRVDERDTMFARMERKAGTREYEDYYADRPRRRRKDDRLRSMPGLLHADAIHHDEAIGGEAQEWFDRIDRIELDPEEVERWADRLRGADDPTDVVHEMAISLGAVAAGCAPLDPAFVYTAKGRFDADYGRGIDLEHPNAIVFLVEMDHAEMRHAPRAPVIRESARQYYRGARISLVMEAAIAAAGFDAKAHYDAHYDVILPPLAVAAGLGEMGRHNILIADRYGSRVRIGAVTTDLPVRPGRPRSLGADRFCRICLKCADSCPSRALTRGEKEIVRGVAKWPTDVERCVGYWCRVGTDCGVCMSVCPFSHGNNAFHNLVRWMVRRLPWFHRPLKWMDDLFYGRRWKGL
ncbi:MAG: reductive dehalogenase domain-containing protein [Planctomycetota bacterium]